MIATMDPHTWIEEQRTGYVRYWNDLTGDRIEVTGVCDGRLDCMVGATVEGILIETVEQARALPKPDLDCPVGHGFRGCCPLDVRAV